MAVITKKLVQDYKAIRPAPAPSLQEVDDAIAKGNKIGLIKFVRTYTNLGLKESKDLIECYTGPISHDGNFASWKINGIELKKALSPIFEVYNRSIWNDEELALPEVQALVGLPNAVANEALLKGIAAALDNWKVMGFKSVFAACRQVLDNLEKCPSEETENLGM